MGSTIEEVRKLSNQTPVAWIVPYEGYASSLSKQSKIPIYIPQSKFPIHILTPDQQVPKVRAIVDEALILKQHTLPSGTIVQRLCKTQNEYKAEYVYTNPNPQCTSYSIVSVPTVIHEIHEAVVSAGHNPHQSALTLALVAGWEKSIFTGNTLPELWRNYADFYAEWIANDDLVSLGNLAKILYVRGNWNTVASDLKLNSNKIKEIIGIYNKILDISSQSNTLSPVQFGNLSSQSNTTWSPINWAKYFSKILSIMPASKGPELSKSILHRKIQNYDKVIPILLSNNYIDLGIIKIDSDVEHTA